jgi:GNAT superfamily N-acetyltransferase
MPLEVVRLEEKHLEDAALLVSGRYQGLCQQVPSLPSRYAEVGTLLGLLRDIAVAGPGVAAIRGGRLVGFLSGWPLPSFRGKRSAYSPEWGNGVDPADSRRIYEAMYAHLSAAWVADGRFTHLASLLVNDRDGIDAWHWLGFGMLAADAVRDLRPVSGPDSDVTVRRAGSQDFEQLMALDAALHHYLASSPVFLVEAEEEDDRAHYQRELRNTDKAIWLACDGTEAVAYLEIGPASHDASTIIVDEKTASITGAFTREQARGRGIGTALLNRALEWARAQGYERCAVDFEPMNPLAARFWLRYFQPVCYALVRHVDERAAP